MVDVGRTSRQSGAHRSCLNYRSWASGREDGLWRPRLDGVQGVGLAGTAGGTASLSPFPFPPSTQHVWPPSATPVRGPFLQCYQVRCHCADRGAEARASGGPDPHPSHGEGWPGPGWGGGGTRPLTPHTRGPGPMSWLCCLELPGLYWAHIYWALLLLAWPCSLLEFPHFSDFEVGGG